ncbi:hypothetical protein LIER_38084 [Lithospermum erythrorhizon]|uniref:Retrovirus-related Pol polyprotein from transposon TNT 1-94-like beta-barrel domain-containing protein n=1 Tax=Lithospermum erythrorhizon TaxID=34254 RepID=A0AAV3PVA4_LITER
MLDRLYVKQLAKPIETEGVKPNDYAQDWNELDRRCLGYIRDHIDTGVIHHVENETTATACWTKLQGLYERKTTVHKVGLIRQLSRLRFEDGQLITEHLNNLEHLFNQLTTMGVNFTDEVQALWLLGTLPESLETLCVSLSTSSADGSIKKEAVTNAILNENLRRATGVEGRQQHIQDTLVFEKKKKSNFRKNNKTVQSKSKGKDKREDKCHYCEKLGHWKSDCYSFKRDTANGTVKPKKKEDEWIIDSGASFHVTPHKNFFYSYEEGDYGVVKMGNNGISKIIVVGDVHLKTAQGHTIILEKVRHIPDLE